MKKMLLITAMTLFFFTTVSAQTIESIEKFNHQTREYKEKLDSIVYRDDEKTVFLYDENFNLTKYTLYYAIDDNDGWEASEVYDYRYDALNRIVSKTIYYDGFAERFSYQYYENGLLSETSISFYDNGVWMNNLKIICKYNYQDLVRERTYYSFVPEENEWQLFGKTEYQYNTHGLPYLEFQYFISDDEENPEPSWMLNKRYCYHYNDRLLCTSLDEEVCYSINGVDHLVLSWKEEYGYDEHDNRISSLDSKYTETGAFDGYLSKSEFVFDDCHNCISSKSYLYEDTEWVCCNHQKYTYDLSVKAENIAGFGFYWQNNVEVATNKMTSFYYYDNENYKYTFYYSKCTGVGEQNEKQFLCWPNPVQESLNILDENVQHIEIFNMEGKQMLISNKPTKAVDVSSLTKGGYLLKAILNNGSVSTQKFIKQ